MRFYYQAQRVTGEIERGEIEAISREEAIKNLENLGLFVTYIEEIKPSIFAKEIRIEFIGERDLILFYRQLSILVESGIPLVEALKTIGGQTAKKNFREAIMGMAKEVASGKKFSEVLSLFPKSSPFQISLVKIGEETGKLAQSLFLLSEHLENNYLLRQRMISILLYPALIFFIMVAILIFSFFYIIPVLEPIFLASKISLPLITKILISLSHFLRNFLPFIVVFLILSIFYLLSLGKRIRKYLSKISLYLPLIKDGLRKIHLARVALSISILHEAGVSILEGLALTAEMVGNEIYKEAVLEAKEGVEKGFPLSGTLAKRPDLFPPIFSTMVLIGERTGKTGESLKKISEFFQVEVERAMENFLRILEPLLIVTLGIIVGFVVYSFYLPLYRVISFAGE